MTRWPLSMVMVDADVLSWTSSKMNPNAANMSRFATMTGAVGTCDQMEAMVRDSNGIGR